MADMDEAALDDARMAAVASRESAVNSCLASKDYAGAVASALENPPIGTKTVAIKVPVGLAVPWVEPAQVFRSQRTLTLLLPVPGQERRCCVARVDQCEGVVHQWCGQEAVCGAAGCAHEVRAAWPTVARLAASY